MADVSFCGTVGALVGLALKAFETPNLESPPTNSLPPLRCPLRPGVVAAASSGVRGGVLSSVRPEASSALKEKLGRVDAVLRCALEESERGISMCMEAEAGLRDELLELCPLDRGYWRACGKEKSGLDTMVITGPPGIVIESMPREWPGVATSAMFYRVKASSQFAAAKCPSQNGVTFTIGLQGSICSEG